LRWSGVDRVVDGVVGVDVHELDLGDHAVCRNLPAVVRSCAAEPRSIGSASPNTFNLSALQVDMIDPLRVEPDPIALGHNERHGG
jgi:hypothetical protein